MDAYCQTNGLGQHVVLENIINMLSFRDFLYSLKPESDWSGKRNIVGNYSACNILLVYYLIEQIYYYSDMVAIRIMK